MSLSKDFGSPSTLLGSTAHLAVPRRCSGSNWTSRGATSDQPLALPPLTFLPFSHSLAVGPYNDDATNYACIRLDFDVC